jgi:mitochondrial fission protein ELM1
MERPSPPAVIAPETMPAITWALSDGAAGNARQAEALALAVGAGSVQSSVLESRLPWRAWAPRMLPGSAHAFGSAFAVELTHPPHLAIGCGRQAALATRLLRRRGARTVQILDPRLDPRHWDIVVAPRHDHLRGDNVIATLGSLHPVDDLWLAQGRARFAEFSALPGPRTSLLLGGPSRHVALATQDVVRVVAQLQADIERHGGSLLVTTSRRTPPQWRDALRERVSRTPGIAWFGPGDGDNPYAGLLAWADRIVCSPDSVNMVSEACATAVPVYVFEPQRAQGRLRQFIDALRAHGRIRPMADVLEPYPVTPLRETTRVAAEVRARLGL